MTGIVFYVSFSILYSNCLCKQYRVSVVSVGECKDPDPPYTDVKPFVVKLEVYNSSKGPLVRGNFTVESDVHVENLRGSLSLGKETPSGIKWRMVMKELDCNNFTIKSITGVFGIPLKRCMFKKGEYRLNDVDIDKADTALVVFPARFYGMFVARFAITGNNRTYTCWMLHVQVHPKKKL